MLRNSSFSTLGSANENSFSDRDLGFLELAISSPRDRGRSSFDSEEIIYQEKFYDPNSETEDEDCKDEDRDIFSFEINTFKPSSSVNVNTNVQKNFADESVPEKRHENENFNSSSSSENKNI